MTAFSYEIASVTAAVQRAYPEHEQGVYAIPWYLVVGNPGTGRTAALHVMNLSWRGGDGPVLTGLPQQLCTYWLPAEAVFVEPESAVLGPSRQPDMLRELCAELRRARPREPIDGILLVLSVADFIDQSDTGIEAYANSIRAYLVEITQALGVDVPTYVVLTRYDAVWGFAEVFQWSAERTKEDPWGFTLPADTPSQESLPRIKDELEGLNARLEAFCFAKLCSEDPSSPGTASGPYLEQRIRAFHHLVEVRALIDKLRTLFNVLAMANSYERSPWIRAVALGSAIPGMGDRMRAGVARFFNMGLGHAQPAPVTSRPGGLPLHAFMGRVVLPERDIVPLRSRWRDDQAVRVLLILAAFFLGGALVFGLIFAMKSAEKRRTAPPPTIQVAPAPKR